MDKENDSNINIINNNDIEIAMTTQSSTFSNSLINTPSQISSIGIDKENDSNRNIINNDDVEIAMTTQSSTFSNSLIKTPEFKKDISMNKNEKPVQPMLLFYPKTNNRNFQSSYFNKFNWLEYSISDDVVFCFPCRHFSLSASSSSVTTNTPQLHNNKKTKLFKTTNRYQILSQDIDPGPDPPLSPNLDNDGHNDVFKPPPPIFVRGVTNYSNLTTAFIELIGVDNFFCKASADRLKIQTANPESYRSLIHFLKDEGAEYHTYQLKEDKPLRVVIRNLHHTTEPDTIKEELEVRMFDVRRVTNVLHRVTKAPLPLFFVDLEPQIKSNEIFQLTSLLHTKIRVEEPYKSKILSQCINCQEYGHTKTYCGYPPRCVRCGAGHKTPDCPNQRSDPPKCALCSGNHPASYKGCSIYKDLQRVKKPFTKSNFVSTNTKTNFSNVKDSRPSNDTHLNQSNTHFPTYAQATSGRPVNNAASETTPDLNNTITRFLEEFKSLLNPLMSLLTTVIDKLLTKL
ncbi:hypothetical protein QTP88_024104 [Uroleucon formosanum]